MLVQLNYRAANALVVSRALCRGCNIAIMSNVLIVKLKRAANCEDLPLPRKMTELSAGFDLSAAVKDPVTLAPAEIRVIPCGFHMALPPGYEAQVRPRSGLASRHGVTLVNTPGTIDADFRGEVMVPVIMRRSGSRPK